MQAAHHRVSLASNYIVLPVTAKDTEVEIDRDRERETRLYRKNYRRPKIDRWNGEQTTEVEKYLFLTSSPSSHTSSSAPNLLFLDDTSDILYPRTILIASSKS